MTINLPRCCVNILKTGKINYTKALEIQNYVAKQLILKKNNNLSTFLENTIILTEHNPVYTIGIRSKDYTNLNIDELKNLGAEFHQTNRGGLITFHGPGQLVAYPIINLKEFNLNVRKYVCFIEKTIIDTCQQFGISANISPPHTGVWINDHKICAIGIHCSRYITTHGLALNCSTDMKWFDHIVPCGIEGKGVTSLSKQLNKHITIDEATIVFLNSFKKIFNCELKEYNNEEIRQIFKC